VADGQDGLYILDCSEAVPVMLQLMSLARVAGGVKVAWEISDETDAIEYRLCRARPGEDMGPVIATVPADGRGRYEFIDTTAPTGWACRYTLSAVFRSGAIRHLGSRDLAAETPDVLSLAQNVPNPFNPRTTIAFTLPEPARVRLEVFDAQGKLVEILLDKSMSAGRHQAYWNGLDRAGQASPSGVYFYRLRTGWQVLTRQMILLK